jgi:hypothetical protein
MERLGFERLRETRAGCGNQRAALRFARVDQYKIGWHFVVLC